jgi:ammonium transporter, Amt family
MRSDRAYPLPPTRYLTMGTLTILWLLFPSGLVPEFGGYRTVAAQDSPAAPRTSSGVDGNEPPILEAATSTSMTGVTSAELADATLRGDNAWMLTCSALVLFMTAPGLALFYSGLVRKKNVLSVMMQCLFLMALMTVIWALWGYTLAFGGDSSSGWNRWIGSTEFLAMSQVSRYWDTETQSVLTPMEGSLPRLTHMLFQGMFFIITPALMCGAFAERMKFSAVVMLSILWGTFVYCPLCHWVWDAGPLAYGEPGAILGGALDYAGGTVVHVSSGISALVCALLVGKRLGHGIEPMPPHNLTYTTLGAAMLWVGWFGFNAGSGLAADELASQAMVVTHFSAAAGALAWACLEWVLRGRPSVLGTSSGAVAGLVCITPAAGFVSLLPALVMGALAGLVCFYACTGLKNWIGYDDSLDAFGVHGVGGALGAILTGVFATRACQDVNEGQPVGLIDGNPQLLFGQSVAIIVTMLFASVVTFFILKVVDATVGLRVSQEREIEGLDVTEHGEEGYIYL